MDHSHIFIFNISDDISKDGASLLCLVKELLPVITVCLTGPQLLSLCPSLIPRVHLSLHISEENCTAFHKNDKSTVTECLKALDDLCLNFPKIEGNQNKDEIIDEITGLRYSFINLWKY